MHLLRLCLFLLFALPLHPKAVKEIHWAERIPPEEIERLQALAEPMDRGGSGQSCTWESAVPEPAMDGR